MSALTIEVLYGIVTLVVMFSGMPIAFALGVVATCFMYCWSQRQAKQPFDR